MKKNKSHINTEYPKILYSLLLSIGYGDSLIEMLKLSISAYLKHLHCSACYVYKFKKANNEICEIENIFNLPYTHNIKENKQYDLISVLNSEDFKNYHQLEIRNEQNQFTYLYELPQFGILKLVRNEKIDKEIFNNLASINNKLAQSCILFSEKEKTGELLFRTTELLNMIPQMILEINNHGIIQYLNEFAKIKLAINDNHHFGKFNFYNLFEISDKEKITKHIERARFELNTKPKEFDIKNTKGKILHCAIYADSIIKEKNISGYRIILLDISEKKTTEKLLINSKATNKAIIDALPDTLLHLNKNGNLINHNIINNNILAISNFEINNKITEIFPHSISKKIQNAISFCLDYGTFIFEFDLPIDTQHLYFECRMVKVNNYEVILLMRDITNIRNFEIKLKIANDTKNKIFSLIGHDVKTPLATIHLVISKLLSSDMNYKKEFLIDALQLIEASTDQTRMLLDNILNWSKGQLGNLKPNPVVFNVINITEDIINIFKNLANQKNIKIKHKYHSDIMIYADATMINTILRNLIGNAIKFTNNNGEITVMYKKQFNFIDIYVKDNGIGLSEELLNNIFKSDIHESTIGTEGEKGTGLGLSICKVFTDLNNGKIKAENNKDIGCSFILSLPHKPLQQI